MPPSPSFRRSPGRERRMENTHKRGRSFESGLPLKARDDDLALFNDMQNKEHDDFLLHTSDDLEDSISKLRYFSDIKLGITIPVRRESSDLLNAEGEKNDYDWLLTPPDTPLFPSLDDDERKPANLLPRGRPRSQPVAILSTGERAHRTSRSSASPHRLSPSPRSSNSLGQMRGRPSSAPRSSPPPALRPATPSRRPSTPPNKPSTPPPRSSSPAFRRMSTGSSGQAPSYGRQGTSPIKASRGNSASPKFRGWQVNLDGFSSDAPPNLCTSLANRPTSHTRGLSPSSRNGRDPSPKFGRQSMSPTASRSASSSRSHERDCLSTYSRGSVASSGDDDVDSLQSTAVGISSSLAVRKNGVTGNNKIMSFAKKPSRTVSASSAPKRSFDSALRQMDHRKTPQSMFRPLLSSVPTTNFYVGKANNIHRPMFSRNSSLTTSSTASSEQGVSVSLDVEGGDHDLNILAGEWERTQVHDNQEEIFIFDKVDETNEDVGHEISATKQQNNDKEFDVCMTNKVGRQEFKNPMGALCDSAGIATASESSCGDGNYSEVGFYEIMATCPECGKRFRVTEMNANRNICQECSEMDVLFTAVGPGTALPVTHDQRVQSELAIQIDRVSSGVQINVSMPELPESSCSKALLNQHETMNEQDPDCLPNSCPLLVINQKDQEHSFQLLDRLQEASDTQSTNENKFHQSQNYDHPNLRVDASQGAGISVLLLQRSGSSKWPFVQGRALSATNILCSEPSYTRDNTNAMKCSFECDSASASSSVDLGSSRQTCHVQSQLNNNKCEVDRATSDNDAKAHKNVSHSETSISANETAICTRSETEEHLSNFMEIVEYEAFRETVLIPEEYENSLEDGKLSLRESSSITQAVDGDISALADSCVGIHISDSHILSHSENVHLHDRLVTHNLNDEDCTSCVSAEEALSKNSDRSMHDIEVSNDVPDSSINEEGYMLNGICPHDKYDDATKNSSAAILELGNDHDSFKDIQTKCMPYENPSNMETFHEQSATTASEKGVSDSALESNIIGHAYGIHEESTVTVEVPRGPISRSLTLEEATDTILFCSSIIHDLAYKAANIGMEKELMLLEGSRPTVTILANSIPNQKDSRKIPDKNVPKSQKFRRKKLEAHNKPPEPGNVKPEDSTPSDSEIPNKPDSGKPLKPESKCNCTVM